VQIRWDITQRFIEAYETAFEAEMGRPTKVEVGTTLHMFLTAMSQHTARQAGMGFPFPSNFEIP